MVAVNRMRFRPGRWVRISAMIILPLMALMTALWIRHRIETDGFLAILAGLVFLPTYIIGLLALRFLVFAPRKCRRIFRQNLGLHQPITVELSDEACEITGPYGSSRIPWRDFHGYRANSDVIALLQSEAQCLILPSRIFANAEERREALALIAREVVQR
jgi:hypothetical protein